MESAPDAGKPPRTSRIGMSRMKTATTRGRRQPVWMAVLLASWLTQSGCTATQLTGAAVGVDMVSLNTTKKTIGDHVASGITGQDCSIISLTETGTYCPEKLVVDRSRLYCYRTLADVECHHIPDPYKNGYTALASPPPDLKPAAPKAKGWFDD